MTIKTPRPPHCLLAHQAQLSPLHLLYYSKYTPWRLIRLALPFQTRRRWKMCRRDSDVKLSMLDLLQRILSAYLEHSYLLSPRVDKYKTGLPRSIGTIPKETQSTLLVRPTLPLAVLTRRWPILTELCAKALTLLSSVRGIPNRLRMRINAGQDSIQ